MMLVSTYEEKEWQVLTEKAFTKSWVLGGGSNRSSGEVTPIGDP